MSEGKPNAQQVETKISMQIQLLPGGKESVPVWNIAGAVNANLAAGSGTLGTCVPKPNKNRFSRSHQLPG